jgi:aspartate/methionine/tyrosine aminotransferase
VVNAEYAVRGEVLLRAQELDQQKKMKIVYCNIGNPHALGQKPLSFPRRVLSVLMNPEDLNRKDLPSDVIERADRYLKMIGNGAGVGAYTDSQGVLGVRQEVADFLGQRDGYPGDPAKIFLTSGASAGVELIARALLRSSDDALIVPIPQYPLYSATTSLLDGHFEGYELKEEANWDTDVSAIEAALDRVRKLNKIPRGIVVINPGNPVGSTLSEQTVRKVVELCEREKIVLLADEVYQENVYAPDKKFVSFRKALLDLRKERKWDDLAIQLVSFHSISKGVSGECGLRGGYFELKGFDPDVKAQIYKLASISLCPNVPGQFAVGLMVNPPKSGSPSYDLDQRERRGIFESLARRATKMAGKLNALEGVTCQPVEGAMYAFPSLTLPKRFVEEAAKFGKHPDTLYSLRLLDATGIVVVPGNGFGQKEGTYHFRTTILPPEDVLDEVLERFQMFHTGFMNEWK